MVIVSQNKKTIINFNNCADIHISNTIKKEYDIIAVTSLGMTCKLAEYETEERAEEVLQEITKTYFEENCEFENGIYHLQKIYEIPDDKEVQE